MTEQLHQRLADLASGVGTPAPADPAGLWRAGKQRQRRRTAAGAVAACAVVLAGVAGAGLLLPAADLTPAPSATTTTPALPDRLYTPGRWLESNDDDPVGPFAALLTAGQGWSGTTSYVGISATTGEYRRLALPQTARDAGPDDDAVLSPSGRYVAYWRGGEPTGKAVTSATLELREGVESVVGLGIYDTVTAQMHAVPVATEKGLVPETIVWADDDTVYFQASQLLRGHEDGYAGRIEGQGWTTSFAAPVAERLRLRGVGLAATALASDGEGALLFPPRAENGRSFLWSDLRSGRVVPVTVSEHLATWAGIAVAGNRRLAALTKTPDDRVPNTISTGTPDGTARRVPHVQATRVRGWADGGVVVDEVREGITHDFIPSRLARVDPTTGRATGLVDFDRVGEGQNLDIRGFASELFDVAPVHRAEPDWPTDPRVFIGLGAAAAVLLAVLWTWRRREQR